MRAPLEARLETDHVEQSLLLVLGTELDHGIPQMSVVSKPKPNWAHGPVAESFVATTRHFFDRQATFKKFLLFERARFSRFCFAELIHKFSISFLVQRAVDKVCRFALFPAVHVERMVKVDAVCLDDRCNRIKEVQTVTAKTLKNIVGESITCQRTCGNKCRAIAFKACHFFAVQRDVRKFCNLLFDKFTKNVAVHRQGIACWHCRFARAIQEETPEQSEFRF